MAKVPIQNGNGFFSLRYLAVDEDRHGNRRVYVRRRGFRKVRLRSEPGTPEFLREYERATATQEPIGNVTRATKRIAAKTSLRWLCIEYYRCAAFKQLGDRTQTVRRAILDRFCSIHGHKPFSALKAPHVRRFRDEMSDRPEAANSLLKALRQVYAFGLEYEIIDHNPVREVAYLRSRPGGFHTWSLDEVRRFEARHAIGTKARLALALLLYTGQRRSDVVRLGPQHAKQGWLKFTQVKNQHRNPVTLAIPILPQLQAIIDQTEIGHLSYLVTEFGKPFSVDGFGNWFRKRCNEAGLPHCTAHGLRKTGATIAAENGATERQLMAMFGWSTMKEAARYTRSAQQPVLAGSGMPHLVPDQK